MFCLFLQSKNGGLAAWEPAGTQKWFEVSITSIHIHELINNIYVLTS